jgi:hypothetical protein
MSRSTAWVRKWRAFLIDKLGGRCAVCTESNDLEFAHVVATECHGKGRGSTRRIRDVLKHPGAYILLCMNCHDALDGRARRKRHPEIRNHL